MRLLPAVVLMAAAALARAASKDEPPKPCTAKSPSGLFYDLNPMAIALPAHGESKAGARNTSWIAKGYDYGSNFTLNFCAPVVETLDDVEGIDRKHRPNISAFYTARGRTYSIGQLSTEPVFRGRKFVLNYTDGSPCSTGSDREERRKSSIVSLLCDRDTADPTKPKVSVSLVGWSPDECTYFFEAKSPYSCGDLLSQPQNVGPGSVFSIIMLIALAVYVLGGVAYQRIVMHQRGWRQLPNYAMWASIGSFLSGLAFLALSCCSRAVPRQRGYSQLPSHGRGRNADAENRLIDSYEEWYD